MLRPVGRCSRQYPTRTVYVPSIVALEIAQKVWTGKLLLRCRGRRNGSPRCSADWLGARAAAGGEHVPTAAYELPEPFHRDPADRIIVAETRALDATLLTSDRKIIAYAAAGHVAG